MTPGYTGRPSHNIPNAINIFRLHSSFGCLTLMQRRLSVCLCVCYNLCVLATLVNCAKTDEPIETSVWEQICFQTGS